MARDELNTGKVRALREEAAPGRSDRSRREDSGSLSRAAADHVDELARKQFGAGIPEGVKNLIAAEMEGQFDNLLLRLREMQERPPTLDPAATGSGPVPAPEPPGRKATLLSPLAFLGIVAISGIIAGAMALGLPALVNSDDAAEAKVLAETTRAELTPRINRLEGYREEDERRTRRINGLTVRWLSDEQRRQCKGIKAIAEGVRTLAVAQTQRRRKQPLEPAKIDIDCEQSSMPPELLELVAQSRQQEAD